MAEQQKWTYPQCSRMISPDDSIIFAGNSGLRDLASDRTATLLGGRAYLCPWCRRDLSDSVRVHLYGCSE